jgi:choline dehydrogenase-like flavoprotein
MASPTSAERTSFSLDVLGRYVCNGLDEALRSADRTARRADGSPQNDARPFDVIVVGGGTFGAAVAAHIFSADMAHRHRVLVLEGGPFLLTEHVQDLPMIGLNVPGATSIAALRAAGQDRQTREQVWGLAWHSSTAFPGLAYCVGGRSLYWGGWSPQLIDTEMPTAATAANPWPKAVVDDLNNRYFAEAAEQIGVDETNDFIFGPLQTALRQQLYDGITAGRVTDAITLTDLPDPAAVRALGASPGRAALLDILGLPASSGSTPSAQALRDMAKLEAPLAVQTRSLSGFFPFNKFSTVPILMKASRLAFSESGGDDVKKRLMIVPHCHVTRLITGRTQGGLNVLAIETNQGIIPVQAPAPVVIACGTIESTRLVMLALDGEPVLNLAGNNLLAHLRSNLTIRIPRTALAGLSSTVRALQAGALIVKGRHQHGDGTLGHYHLQITAAGLGPMGTDSEAELFKKIPDIDTFDNFRNASESHIVITMRGIGQMETQISGNRIALDPEADEFGARRAIVSIAPTQKDLALWDAMDKAADDVANIFAAGGPMELLGKNRDGLGTTHHEAGTLWMGDQGPARSPTDVNCQLNQLTNAYVAAPALLPSTGSPNPMLTGIALARRLGDHLAPPPVPYQPARGFTSLFDGFDIANWRMSIIRNQPGRDDPGHFLVVDGTLESVTGTDIGLFWCTTAMPPDFILRLDWLRWEDYDNSGVFIRFPNPETKDYNNNAFVAVDFGFEVQIDEFGAPDGQDIHKTGAIYRNDGRRDSEIFTQKPARPVGQWNEYEIRVKGQNYRIFLNGDQVCVFDNPYPGRGLPSTPAAPTYVGLQTHTGRVAFRNIRYMAHP